MLYGASLMLEFVTLVVLRIKEPELKRGFRVPGGMTGAVLTGVFPLLLLLLAVVESNHETVLGMNGLLFGALIMSIAVVITTVWVFVVGAVVVVLGAIAGRLLSAMGFGVSGRIPVRWIKTFESSREQPCSRRPRDQKNNRNGERQPAESRRLE